MAIITLPMGLTGDTDTGALLRDGVDVSEQAEAWSAVARWIRATADYSVGALADRVGIRDDRTVARWMTGQRIPGPGTRRVLLALARELLLRRVDDQRME